MVHPHYDPRTRTRTRTQSVTSMAFSNSILIESRSARDEGLAYIATPEVQEATLNKVKSILFALWEGNRFLTSQQVAAYYEVSDDVIRQNLLRKKSEFDQDGVKTLRGEDLDFVRDIMSLTNKARAVTVLPVRAVIRMGFILQESEVAVQVRTATLNVLQGVGQVVDKEVLSSLVLGHPILSPFCLTGELMISAPLADHYAAIERNLKKKFPDGPIPGLDKAAIRGKLAELSTYTKNWKFDTRAELKLPVGRDERTKYPDLLSPVIEFEVDGSKKTAVFLFQLMDMLVDLEDVENVVGKNYLKVCRNHYGVDYVFVFLVSPLGATPVARDYIKDHLPNEMRGFIGVMTVKEVAELLVHQARTERKSNFEKGNVRKQFVDILNYEIPEEPLLMMMM
jgi:hypothetical protein